MNLVVDESVDQPIVERLRTAGHSVTVIAELAPSLADDEVLRIADEQAALLLTQDRDFGELVFRLTAGAVRPLQASFGIAIRGPASSRDGGADELPRRSVHLLRRSDK